MPATLLKIDTSARRDGSVTRALTAKITEVLAPDTVITRDLADNALPQLTEGWVGANFTPDPDRSDDQRATLALSDALIAEVQAADTIVIGVPVYNFGVPAALKAWVDLVARAGVTFRYTEAGPKGLLSGKRAVLAVASGGTEVDSAIDYATPYMTHVLGFLGITDVEVIAADQLMQKSEDAVPNAMAAIEQLAA